AVARAKDLAAYFKSYGAPIKPIVSRVYLSLPHPTISDSISDLERLKRSLDEKGLSGMRFSHDFIAGMFETLRYSNWDVDISYVKGEGMPDEAIFLTSREICGRRYGLAVDIGTTTVVVYLVNLTDGSVVDMGSTYNSQMRFGDDVITRIVYASEGDDAVIKLDELRNAVVEDINSIAVSLMERNAITECEIDSAVVAGNTTMAHIFWGLNPASIREEPYIPTMNFFPLWKAGTARLKINRQAPVYTLPCIASYVGGDIVSGVLASKMYKNEETALFMDIGTNGEIAIGNSDWLMTAACSAGPCFEGSGIKCGMRATEGAIESVKIDPTTFEPELGVIGGVHPTGICGSGMIDAISEMFLTGLIDQKGRLAVGKSQRIRKGEEGLEYVFYHNEAMHRYIALTEADIENLLRAKAAIYAGVTTLLNEAGLTFDDLSKVYIAGGFGNYLNVDRAITLGMLPDMAKDKFSFIGNASITGAYLCLLSEELRREAEDIASKMTYIELSVSRGFMDEYMSALFLPHTNMDMFPSVKRILQGSS
ncbi:MAG: ASKHA domain-containing protein, partial [Nitrospiraceae bacterium]|nr:ASKHA domain-containing protein [Nitrospiraceae bacterium]